MAGIFLTAFVAASVATWSAPVDVPDASPAIWKVEDSDTTVYLFGTFHALDGRSEWFNDEVRLAFSRSDELVLETLLPKMKMAAPGTPSPGRQIRGHSLTPSASFLGATRMAVTAGKSHGLDVGKGADMVLRKAAEESGKPVAGLESVEFQLGMLSRMAPASARPAGRAGMDPRAMSEMAAIMAHMQDSWNRGDQRIFTILLNQMRQTSPDNYRTMFPERNEHWADWIINRMERPGTVFVAVGAGHFAGPDSVLAKLGTRGVLATRLN